MPRVWSLAVNGPAAAVKATKQTESESVAILARRGLFHRMVTLGQVMNCTVRASEHMDDNLSAKGQDTSVCVLHERYSGVQCPRRLMLYPTTGLQRVQGTLPGCLRVPVNDWSAGKVGG
jgi:hypothetical protein